MSPPDAAAWSASGRQPGAATARDERPEVLINGRFFGQRVTGVQRYARETLRSLDELLAHCDGAGARWTVLAPRGTALPRFRHLASESWGRLNGHLWEQLELPWRVRGGLLMSFGFTGPLLQRRQIVTVHDAAVVRMPHTYGRVFRHGYRWLVRAVTARATRTLAVSQFGAREAVSCFGAPRERLRVTTEGWQHLERVEADTGILDRLGLRERPFALAVSSPTPAKNFGAIAAAMGLLGRDAPRCVVAGAADPAVFRAAEAAGDALVRAGYVSDGELKALYQHAHCFVFPSLYEGFGIPPLEAMACGCPVIASTAAAVQEVCGDAALYFDPADAASLAARLRELFADAGLHARLRAAGSARVRAYSWDEAARLNLAAIREVLDEMQPRRARGEVQS